MKEAQIQPADDGIRLDRWFKRHMPGVAHGMLEKSLRRGMVRLDRKKVKASARIAEGQVLSFPEEWSDIGEVKPKKRSWEPDEQDLQRVKSMVIFENDFLLALNKPAGLSVQGGSKQGRNLDAMLEGLKPSPAAERPKLVHRLDKDTSGALLVARSAQSAAELARHFKQKSVEKRYNAVIVGVPEIREGRITLPLAKAKGKTYETMQVDEYRGQPAETLYRVIETVGDRAAWVEMWPVTGRTHQLRVHMAAIGHPILGDGKYGGQEAFLEGSMELSRQLHLHARQVKIESILGVDIDITAAYPEHLRLTAEALGIELDEA